MLRITTGGVKNKRLKIPEIEGFRGVQEKAKMSLFSMIGDKINGSVCLDLFAGSGNLGLEALSRGAVWCDFVDENPSSTLAIEENINNCGFLEMSQVFRKNAIKYVGTCEKKYDFIFMDPFYEDVSQTHLLKSLGNILAENGEVYYFHKSGFDIKTIVEKSGLQIKDSRKFGDSVFEVLPHR